jgi:hypothetical protein
VSTDQQPRNVPFVRSSDLRKYINEDEVLLFEDFDNHVKILLSVDEERVFFQFEEFGDVHGGEDKSGEVVLKVFAEGVHVFDLVLGGIDHEGGVSGWDFPGILISLGNHGGIFNVWNLFLTALLSLKSILIPLLIYERMVLRLKK